MKVLNPQLSDPMRLPRWLVVSLLSVSILVLLGGGALWWGTWPARTARRVIDLNAAGEWNEAAKMYDKHTLATAYSPGDLDSTTIELWKLFFRSLQLEPDGSRSLSDIFAGRQNFQMIYRNRFDGSEIVLPLIIERNIVRIKGGERTNWLIVVPNRRPPGRPPSGT